MFIKKKILNETVNKNVNNYLKKKKQKTSSSKEFTLKKSKFKRRISTGFIENLVVSNFLVVPNFTKNNLDFQIYSPIGTLVSFKYLSFIMYSVMKSSQKDSSICFSVKDEVESDYFNDFFGKISNLKKTFPFNVIGSKIKIYEKLDVWQKKFANRYAVISTNNDVNNKSIKERFDKGFFLNYVVADNSQEITNLPSDIYFLRNDVETDVRKFRFFLDIIFSFLFRYISLDRSKKIKKVSIMLRKKFKRKDKLRKYMDTFYSLYNIISSQKSSKNNHKKFSRNNPGNIITRNYEKNILRVLKKYSPQINYFSDVNKKVYATYFDKFKLERRKRKNRIKFLRINSKLTRFSRKAKIRFNKFNKLKKKHMVEVNNFKDVSTINPRRSEFFQNSYYANRNYFPRFIEKYRNRGYKYYQSQKYNKNYNKDYNKNRELDFNNNYNRKGNWSQKQFSDKNHSSFNKTNKKDSKEYTKNSNNNRNVHPNLNNKKEYNKDNNINKKNNPTNNSANWKDKKENTSHFSNFTKSFDTSFKQDKSLDSNINQDNNFTKKNISNFKKGSFKNDSIKNNNDFNKNKKTK